MIPVDVVRKLDLSGGEAELAAWFAERYGRPEDGEDLEWFLLYILFRHWQGHLLVRQDDPRGEGAFASMATIGETETAALLRERGRRILSRLGDLTSGNPALFGDGNSRSPVVVEGGCYSFRRFYQREIRLLKLLEGLTGISSDELPEPEQDPVNRALQLLETRRLVIISGGPGTGKTTLIGKLLKRWVAGDPLPGRDPRIALAAPTGRAASRLMETLGPEPGLPREAFTLHKLLEFRRGTGGPGRKQDNPLAVDLVVVDEASMIDLGMMVALMDALPAEARLVLVGDRDQLPSVGAGTLLTDFLEGFQNPGHRLYGAVLLLERIHRSIPGITRLSSAVRDGNVAEVLDLLKSGREAAVSYAPIPAPGHWASLFGGVWPLPEGSPSGFSDSPDQWKGRTGEILGNLQRLGDTGILSPVRKGFSGVEALNGFFERRAGTLHGRPVIMTVNNYELDLYNGDRGMIFLFRGVPLVFFPDGDGLRSFPLGRVEGLETCYAMTVHKSQGSEFRTVFLVFPEMAEGLQIREILYTGITRAREKVVLLSEDGLLEKGINRRVARDSRIVPFLQGQDLRIEG